MKREASSISIRCLSFVFQYPFGIWFKKVIRLIRVIEINYFVKQKSLCRGFCHIHLPRTADPLYAIAGEFNGQFSGGNVTGIATRQI